MRRPEIIVHSRDQVRAALAAAEAANLDVVIASAPGAAAYLGAALFREMTDGAEHAVLDCGDAPGLALNALREGVKAVRLDASEDVRARVADIARQSGGELAGARQDPALDLLDCDDAELACRTWLDKFAGKETRP